MKRTKIFIILFFAIYNLNAQMAQEIKGIAKENKSKQYYYLQSEIWQSEVEKSRSDANAWLNLYKATRAYLQKKEPQIWLGKPNEIYDQLENVIRDATKHIEGTFELYLMKSMNTRDGKVSSENLLKAYEIDPERTETYEGLLTYYAVTFNEQKASEIAQRILQVNLYSHANYMWNLNSLKTASQGGIFITHGDMDTMPRWVLQYGRSIRNDVLVINEWLMVYDQDYRNTAFQKMSIPTFSKHQSSFEDLEKYKNILLKHIFDHKPDARDLYFGCGTDIKLFEELRVKDKMYLIGNAFLYSKIPVDNMALTKKNFEKVYDLGYLTANFQNHPQDEVIKKFMNVTYIPGLMKLQKHYEVYGEKEKARHYATLINRIAEDSGRKAEIMSWY